MCQDSTGKVPQQAAAAGCSQLKIYMQPLPLAVIAGGAAALFFLDGWLKLLGVAALAYGVIGTGLSYQVQAQLNPQTGVFDCNVIGASGW